MSRFSDDRIRLLLVDDEEGFRKTLSRRLEKRGFSPLQADSGEACLDVIQKEPVDIVIMDVKMPGMNGIDTLRSIKQRNEFTQVILLTGNVAVADGIEGIQAGAFDYLTKPVEIDHLVNKINQAYEILRLEEEHIEEQEYRAKLEKKMVDTERLASLGTLSTGIAHEINNPLAIINESAGFMKQILTSPETEGMDRKDALLLGIEKIEKSIKRARAITHQLLGHVKRQDSQYAKINLKELLNETLGLLKRNLKDKHVGIKWKIDEKETVFWSDPYQLRQVLMNLLTNAVHAVSDDGSITLTTRESDTEVILEIHDDGVGIAKENLGKIFDPFFTTKSFEEGTGLGLFVVHKILSNLNGEIDVKSTLGEGTSFTIKLPKRFEKKRKPR